MKGNPPATANAFLVEMRRLEIIIETAGSAAMALSTEKEGGKSESNKSMFQAV